MNTKVRILDVTYDCIHLDDSTVSTTHYALKRVTKYYVYAYVRHTWLHVIINNYTTTVSLTYPIHHLLVLGAPLLHAVLQLCQGALSSRPTFFEVGFVHEHLWLHFDNRYGASKTTATESQQHRYERKIDCRSISKRYVQEDKYNHNSRSTRGRFNNELYTRIVDRNSNEQPL